MKMPQAKEEASSRTICSDLFTISLIMNICSIRNFLDLKSHWCIITQEGWFHDNLESACNILVICGATTLQRFEYLVNH